MAEFVIRRAERKQARLRFAVCAASNGGKTWTSIELAFGIVEELLDRRALSGSVEGKVGLVDTERKSAQLYAHLGPYDTVDLDPPYTVERYVGAMNALERAGCAVIILDSISHAWAGPGGVLALLDQFDDRARFSAFGKAVNPAQDEFVDAILRSPAHVIATMRSKTAWVLEKQEKNGRTVTAPRRIGLAPIQRPGIEYEFTTLVDLDTDTHIARVVKNRCPVFQDWAPKRLTRAHGRALAAWLLEGAPVPSDGAEVPVIERARATADAALRAIKRAENAPDLARVFDDSQRALRSFKESLDEPGLEALAGMLAEVVAAKNERKAETGGDRGAQRPPPQEIQEGGPPPDTGAAGLMETTVSSKVAGDLRMELRAQGLGLGEALTAFRISRLEELALASLGRFRDWMKAQPVAPAGRVRPGVFDDMLDDIPF